MYFKADSISQGANQEEKALSELKIEPSRRSGSTAHNSFSWEHNVSVHTLFYSVLIIICISLFVTKSFGFFTPDRVCPSLNEHWRLHTCSLHFKQFVTSPAPLPLVTFAPSLIEAAPVLCTLTLCPLWEEHAEPFLLTLLVPLVPVKSTNIFLTPCS